MSSDLKIYATQLNFTMGDLHGNAALHEREYKAACAHGAKLVVFSELSLVGYPPQDLVKKRAFAADCRTVLNDLAAITNNTTAMLVGFVDWPEGERLPFNAVALCHSGRVQQVFHKRELPNYTVFDEKRLFASGFSGVFNWFGVNVGVAICEDLWFPNVCRDLKQAGAELIVAPNASPYDVNKHYQRFDVVRARVGEVGLPIVYVNQVGAQDELLFDGRSFVMLPGEDEVNVLSAWGEQSFVYTFSQEEHEVWIPHKHVYHPACDDEDIYQGLVLAVRDYWRKTGHNFAVIGLSGGIDSALDAAIMVDALGADNVLGVAMPTGLSSSHSVEDARALAENLGIHFTVQPVQEAVDGHYALLSSIAQNCPGLGIDHEATVAFENVQARVRGELLMNLSNAFADDKRRPLVVTNGNKSEMSVGYATLYGDMNGAFNPLKDTFKMTVYRLANWRNGEVAQKLFGGILAPIPQNTIAKAPSAELREDQEDSHSLPPYPVLDLILAGLIEQEMVEREVIALVHLAFAHDGWTLAKVTEAVNRIAWLVRVSEFKRRQAPPGARITALSFAGMDRRYPIINGYRPEN